jgi:hypothetical protein
VTRGLLIRWTTQCIKINITATVKVAVIPEEMTTTEIVERRLSFDGKSAFETPRQFGIAEELKFSRIVGVPVYATAVPSPPTLQ